MASKTDYQIVSANHLLHGDVVYFGAAGEWSRALSDARIVRNGDPSRDLLSDAEHNADRVVGPYLVDVDIDSEGVPHPRQLREAIRQWGPTVARQYL